MEKSIETIWKEGFSNSDAMATPKLSNLNNKKSNHIVDKYKRMFKNNIILLFMGSFIILIVSFLIGVPYMGVPIFIILNVMVFVNKRLSKKLDGINKNLSSYQYLKRLDSWMKYKTQVNTNLSRILYPYVFISMALGFWFLNIKGETVSKIIVNDLLISFPDMILIFGIPLIGIILFVLIIGLLAILGGRIYKWDLNLVYGRILKKIEELITDVEELKT